MSEAVLNPFASHGLVSQDTIEATNWTQRGTKRSATCKKGCTIKKKYSNIYNEHRKWRVMCTIFLTTIWSRLLIWLNYQQKINIVMIVEVYWFINEPKYNKN